MDKTKKIWMDGKFVDWDEAKFHVLTHSLHYGTGVFEGIRCYNTNNGPSIFRLNEHVQRLLKSAADVEMNIPFSISEITEAVFNTVGINHLNDGYIRPLLYYGHENLGLAVSGLSVHLVIAVWPWGLLLGDGKPGKITNMLREKYRDIVHGKENKYIHWLSYVRKEREQSDSPLFKSWVNSPIFTFSQE